MADNVITQPDFKPGLGPIPGQIQANQSNPNEPLPANIYGLDLNYAAANSWYLYLPIENILGTSYNGLNLHVTRFSLPQMEITSATVSYKGYSKEIPTKVINPASKMLTVEYIIDEKWVNYACLYAWLSHIYGTLNPMIENDDTDAVKADKYKRNSMVIAKKPYFFRYLYPELNQQFKQYEDSYNVESRSQFGIKLKKLLVKPNKTEDEMNLIRRYQKYSPLITAPCTMNLLCKELENVDFDINFNKGAVSMLPTYEDKFEIDTEKLALMKELYRKFSSRKQVKSLESMFDGTILPTDDEYDELRFSAVDLIRDEIRQQLTNSEISGEEVLFYCNVLSKSYKQFNWDFAWDILGDSIVDLIPRGRVEVPVKNEAGFEYLGDRYILAPITEEEAKIIQEEEVFDDFSWDDLLGDDMPSIFDVTDNPFEVDNE